MSLQDHPESACSYITNRSWLHVLSVCEYTAETPLALLALLALLFNADVYATLSLLCMLNLVCY